MGNYIHDKERQVSYMKQRLTMFLDVLDAIEPEHTDVEDIDRLIEMVDDLEQKMQQFKGPNENKPSED